MGRYEVLITDDTCRCFDGASILLIKSALTKDNLKESILIQLKLESFYEKNVVSLFLAITGMDLEGNVIEEKLFQYSDLNVGKYEEFGDRIPIYMDHSNIRKYSICVRKILFQDGSSEMVNTGMCMEVPEIPFPYEEELKEQYIRTVKAKGGTPKVVCTPLMTGRFWRCSCGMVNAEEENECRLCKCKVSSIFDNLEKGTLSNELEEYKRNTAEAEEKRKKKQVSAIKKAAVVFAAAAVVVVIALICKNVISPALTYNKAERYYKNGDYEKAIAEMLSIIDYKDAPEQIRKYKYDQASEMYEEGEHDKAKKIFNDIRGYADSKERYESIVKEDAYDRAVKQMNDKNYEKAMEVFEKDLEYRDSAYYAGCINQEKEDYITAVKQFEMVPESSEFYIDSVARKENCEEAIQEKKDLQHYNSGVNYAKNGYLFSAKKQFEACNGIKNAADYLKTIQETLDEGWVGVYKDTGNQYIGIFCQVNSDLEKTYVVTSQSENFESLYTGVKPNDDGTISLYDSFNDSVDADYKTGFTDESEYKIQKDRSVYKKHSGTRGVFGGGSFRGTSYKSFVKLSLDADGRITEYRKTEETTEAREWYDMSGEHKSRPATSETNEETLSFERIGDEKEE